MGFDYIKEIFGDNDHRLWLQFERKNKSKTFKGCEYFWEKNNIQNLKMKWPAVLQMVKFTNFLFQSAICCCQYGASVGKIRLTKQKEQNVPTLEP